MSRERYIARRIGAGAVAAGLLLTAGFGLVRAVGAIGAIGDAAGDGTVAGAPVTSPPPTEAAPASVHGSAGSAGSGGSAAADSASSAGSAAATPTASTEPAPATAGPPTTTVAAFAAQPGAPSTSPPVGVPPSAEAPATVLVVGDSDAGSFGPYLKELLDGTGVARTTVDYKVSSGLARPDFFDWPSHLRTTLPQLQPQIVVVTFGGNDAQGLSEPDGSNPVDWNDPVNAKETWVAEYTRRAGEVMDLLAEDGRTVVWVGIPNDDSPEMSARLAVQDQAVRAALATRPHVHFVDTWARFSSGNGGWAEYVVDPRDGRGKDVRADDGFHLNENGAEILAVDIADLVIADLRSRGASIDT